MASSINATASHIESHLASGKSIAQVTALGYDVDRVVRASVRLCAGRELHSDSPVDANHEKHLALISEALGGYGFPFVNITPAYRVRA